jgi:hypothetical protein
MVQSIQDPRFFTSETRKYNIVNEPVAQTPGYRLILDDKIEASREGGNDGVQPD